MSTLHVITIQGNGAIAERDVPDQDIRILGTQYLTDPVPVIYVDAHGAWTGGVASRAEVFAFLEARAEDPAACCPRCDATGLTPSGCAGVKCPCHGARDAALDAEESGVEAEIKRRREDDCHGA